jgi:hypothetical protein
MMCCLVGEIPPSLKNGGARGSNFPSFYLKKGGEKECKISYFFTLKNRTLQAPLFKGDLGGSKSDGKVEKTP